MTLTIKEIIEEFDSIDTYTKVGDLRVVKYDEDQYEIELFSSHMWQATLWLSEPCWACPDWTALHAPNLMGPFETANKAHRAIRTLKEKNNGTLPVFS